MATISAGGIVHQYNLVLVDDATGLAVPEPDVSDDAVPFMVGALFALASPEWARAQRAKVVETLREANESYLPAKALLHPRYCQTHSTLRHALSKGAIRWRRPHPRRLEVHAGDWARHLIALGCRDGLDLPAPVADALLAFARDHERQHSAERLRKERRSQ